MVASCRPARPRQRRSVIAWHGRSWGAARRATDIDETTALTANGDFGKPWTFHLKHEHQRIHHARYRDDLTLAASTIRACDAMCAGSARLRCPGRGAPYLARYDDAGWRCVMPC